MKTDPFSKILFVIPIVLMAISRVSVAGVTVEYQYQGQKFEGYLAVAQLGKDEKAPGVLVIPEWWGLNDYVKMRADELAKMGYVAFVADMYGDGANTTDAKKAKELSGALYGKPEMAARAKAALDELSKNDHVDGSKLAAIGFCFGGSACQELAYTGAPIAGIVSFHGGLMQPTDADLKNIHCKFLILNGGIDPNVKPEAIASYLKALDSAHVDYQFVNYSGALHAFTNPDADKVAQANGMAGMIGYNENAARRSWAQMKSFFDELFGASK